MSVQTELQGEDCDMSIIIETILGGPILEKHKITEVNILEVDIEGITEMTTYKEVEVGLWKDNIEVILAGMIEIKSDKLYMAAIKNFCHNL